MSSDRTLEITVSCSAYFVCNKFCSCGRSTKSEHSIFSGEFTNVQWSLTIEWLQLSWVQLALMSLRHVRIFKMHWLSNVPVSFFSSKIILVRPLSRLSPLVHMFPKRYVSLHFSIYYTAYPMHFHDKFHNRHWNVSFVNYFRKELPRTVLV